MPCPSPRDLSDSGVKSRSPAFQADSLLSEPLGKPRKDTQISGLGGWWGIRWGEKLERSREVRMGSGEPSCGLLIMRCLWASGKVRMAVGDMRLKHVRQSWAVFPLSLRKGSGSSAPRAACVAL